MSADVGVEMAHLQLRPQDRLLLCSDGLHDYFLAETEIADVKRSIIRFNEAQMRTAFPANRVLQSARLDVIVNGISAGWLGGAIDIHAMNREWTEGTGLLGNGAS